MVDIITMFVKWVGGPGLTESYTLDRRREPMAHDDGWWPVATFDGSGRFVHASSAFAALLGTTPEGLVGRQAADVAGADEVVPDESALERLRAGEGEVRYLREVTLPSGRRWLRQAQLSTVPGGAGEPPLVRLRLTEPGGDRPAGRAAWQQGPVSLTLDQMRVGIAIVTMDGSLLQANQAMSELSGRTEEELRATDLLAMTHPDDRATDLELGTRAFLGEMDTYTLDKRLVRPDGVVVWVRQEVTVARDADGAPLHLIGQLVDIGELKAVEAALSRSRQELDDLIRSMPIGLVRLDDRARVVSANPAAADIAGVEELAVGTPVFDLVAADDLPRLITQVPPLVEAGVDYTVEFRLVRPDGSRRWIRNDARPVYDAEGTLTGVSGTWLDITDLKAAEEELHRHASHDALTGLWNRRVVFDELRAGIERVSRDGGQLSVLFVDLDGFKEVNDACGHAVGDQVLVEIAGRIERAAGPGWAGRLGGDEFVVVLETGPGATLGPRSVETRADALLRAIGRPLPRLPARSVGASIGIADWAPGLDADMLLSVADRNAYAAKAAGRGRWIRG